ncbi:ABC transporter substrate-binding protein [Chloroflexota bacterium]
MIKKLQTRWRQQLGTRPKKASLVVFFVILAVTAVSIIPGCYKYEYVRVGVIPVIDTLPIHFCLWRPIFKGNMVDVEVVSFSTEEERDAAFLAGEVDAIVCDLPSGILLSVQGQKGKIVRSVMRANQSSPMFAIVATPESDIGHASSLKGMDIAIPGSATAQYIANVLLNSDGIQPSEINRVEVTSYEEALGMLQEKQVTTALLRTPLITAAIADGAQIIIDDGAISLGVSVLVFSQKTIDQRPKAVTRFLFSYEQAVLEINYRPEEYRTLMVDKGGVPAEVAAIYPMPVYEGVTTVVSETEVKRVGDWLVEQKLLPNPISYDNTVTSHFLIDPATVFRAPCCL